MLGKKPSLLLLVFVREYFFPKRIVIVVEQAEIENENDAN
jgi:hypothetical protein